MLFVERFFSHRVRTTFTLHSFILEASGGPASYNTVQSIYLLPAVRR